MTTRDDYRDLRNDLRDALEGLREMLPYVSAYFREKWELDEYVENAEDALAIADEKLS